VKILFCEIQAPNPKDGKLDAGHCVKLYDRDQIRAPGMFDDNKKDSRGESVSVGSKPSGRDENK
jgi:hypothetical protein